MTLKSILLYITFLLCLSQSHAQLAGDVAGYWMSTQKNVIVQIYQDSLDFKAKVVWFDDSDDRSQPMNSRMDVNNPVSALRTQKIIGLEVVRGLIYNKSCRCWQNGKIYDTQSGKTWSASIELENENLAKVRGFWHFEIFGKSMYFKRIKSAVPE